MNLLRTIIFLVGSYYVIRFLVRVFTAPRRTTPPPPQSSTVNYREKKTPRPGGLSGDYIEYEEVKD